MLLEVAEFRQSVESDLDGLVTGLQAETCRRGEAEASAWKSSLPAIADVLRDPALAKFHLLLGGGRSGDVALEYRLPASASWADVVLLGRGKEKPAAVIVELKDWNTRGDRPGPREALIHHAGRDLSHPSDQVRGYVEYCRRFHSAVLEDEATVSGCVFLTGSESAPAYSQAPHEDLVAEYPVFTRHRDDTGGRFPKHLASKLARPDRRFAARFADGKYQQDRGFVRQIGAAIREKKQGPFVLLDEQRAGFERCLHVIEGVLGLDARNAASTENEKAVVIVEGPPGSGKSVVAAQLWAALVDRVEKGSVVLTTTSVAQRRNWRHLFEIVSGKREAAGIVVGANSYNPGITPTWIKSERERGAVLEIKNWKRCLAHFAKRGSTCRCVDDAFDVSIVDEAHALIDPSVPGKEGVAPSGWAMHAGPQAWHIIRASRVSVFLLDGEQSYRDNETTSPESIERFAREQGVTRIERVSLAGAQFRCGGSVEYLRWLDGAFGLGDAKPTSAAWSPGGFQFGIVDDPGALDEALRAKIGAGKSARLLASYARPWATKKEPAPHRVGAPKDFNLPYVRDGERRAWKRIWNYAPEEDYTLFVQAPAGSKMHVDPLCEVGCPYVVRGFDFDYVGVLWLSDLVWRKDRWVANLDHIHESAWKNTRSRARKEGGDGPNGRDLVRRLQRGYRILLSRAIHGAFVWFEDRETREHVESLLGR